MSIRDKTTVEIKQANATTQIDEFAVLLNRWKSERDDADLAQKHSAAPESASTATGELAAHWIRGTSTRSDAIARSIDTLERELFRKRKELVEAKRLERALAIEAVAQVMRQFGITMEELGGHEVLTLSPSLPDGLSPKQPRRARYFGPDGVTWSGYGRRPAWLKKLLDSGHQVGELRQEATAAAVDTASGKSTLIGG